MAAKLDKMSKFIPPLLLPEINPNVRGLLNSWASEDDTIVEQIVNAKEQIFTKLAQFRFLDSLGSNVGVFRPISFNLADAEYRRLIPALSFLPKQVLPTIKEVLNIFFGDNNPQVLTAEINQNELVIQIPSSIPGLRRSLKGAQHFHAYDGTIISVDNILKEMVIDLGESTKTLLVDELEDARFGQFEFEETIASNTAGTTGVTLTFFATADLSAFDLTKSYKIMLPLYPGSFRPDETRAFTVTKQRGILGQTISVGDLPLEITMTDSSGIPDADGFLIFNFGRNNEESLVRYFSRPNNSTILVDPAYTFLQNHVSGEPVNVVLTPYIKPRKDGLDFAKYLVGVTAARILAQQIIRSIVAAGVVVRFIVVEPKCT